MEVTAWDCRYCGGANKDTPKCVHCGAPKVVKIYQEPRDTEECLSLVQKIKSFSWKKHGYIVELVAGFLFLVLFLWLSLFKTYEKVVTIEQFSWEQSAVLEEYTAVRESSWSSYPPEAYDIDVDYRNTGKDAKVIDGLTTETYECGSTETEDYSCPQTRQVELYHYEDIWDNYYTYTINKWVLVEEYPTSGTDHSPFFAEVEISNTYVSGIPILGQQRTIEVPGKYQILFKTNNKGIGEEGYFERDYPYTEWSQFSEDEVYTITVNALYNILSEPEP